MRSIALVLAVLLAGHAACGPSIESSADASSSSSSYYASSSSSSSSAYYGDAGDAGPECAAGEYVDANTCKPCEAWADAGPDCFACPVGKEFGGGPSCKSTGQVVTIGLEVVCCQ